MHTIAIQMARVNPTIAALVTTTENN